VANEIHYIKESKPKDLFKVDSVHKKDKLKKMGHVSELLNSELTRKLPKGATGSLKASVRNMVTHDKKRNEYISEVYSELKYASFVENGTRPGNDVSINTILKWADSKNRQGLLKGKRKTRNMVKFSRYKYLAAKYIKLGIYNRGTDGKKIFSRLGNNKVKKGIAAIFNI
jgi:hypothetical protein